MEVSRLREIEDLLIDDRTKGIPGGVAPFRLGDIGSQSWNLLHEDLPLPVAILKASALAHNGKWMASFLELSGAVISPHGKTTMSPQLFERQLDDGAWAVTVATVHQIQVCRRYGFSRIVLANQLVGRQMRLKASALAHNGKWMASFLELSGAVISPESSSFRA